MLPGAGPDLFRLRCGSGFSPSGRSAVSLRDHGKGVCLYGDPDDFFEYRAYAYRDYMDSRDLRILEDKLFRKKMDHVRRRLDKTG